MPGYLRRKGLTGAYRRQVACWILTKPIRGRYPRPRAFLACGNGTQVRQALKIRPHAETGVALIRNPTRYLSALVAEYHAECADGFANDYEPRLRLWHAAVVIFEVADDPQPWLDQLRDLSLGIISPKQIETTIRSAQRRADHG